MIPRGGRECNFDGELPPETLERSVTTRPMSRSGLSTCVNVRTHLFDVSQRRHVANGRMSSFRVVNGRDTDVEFVVLGENISERSGMAPSTAADPILAEVVRMYESEIGPVTERTIQKLTALVEEHQGIGKWRDAFDAVVWSNVRRLDYVKRCLENERAPRPKRSGRLRTIREKPPAEEVDAETRALQRAALDELRRRQRERGQKGARRTIMEKPPAEDIDPETVVSQRAALAEWRRKRERERA